MCFILYQVHVTALHFAAGGGHTEIVKLLLEKEADVHTEVTILVSTILLGNDIDSVYLRLHISCFHILECIRSD